MNRRLNSYVLLILLTLLQCFAPLLHAHTFGVGQGGGVHLYELSGLHSDSLDAAHVPVLSVHGDESPAIGLVHEYRHDSAVVLSDAQLTLVPQLLRFSHPIKHIPPSSHAPLPPGVCCEYYIPFSQAPPSVLS